MNVAFPKKKRRKSKRDLSLEDSLKKWELVGPSSRLPKKKEEEKPKIEAIPEPEKTPAEKFIAYFLKIIREPPIPGL